MAEVMYRYNPEPVEPFLKEGVTQGWVVQWTGEPGPGRSLKVAALVDDEGNVFLEPTGEWEDVTVTAD